jgi:hypothetical protein
MRMSSQAGEISVVVEVSASEVEVEGIGVPGEVGFDDIEEAIAVEVADGDAHACLRFAIGGVCDAGFNGYIFEGAVLLILIKSRGCGVVGYVDIGPAVVIEIGDGN